MLSVEITPRDPVFGYGQNRSIACFPIQESTNVTWFLNGIQVQNLMHPDIQAMDNILKFFNITMNGTNVSCSIEDASGQITRSSNVTILLQGVYLMQVGTPHK